ncbi:MAG: hypothetical protein J5985_00155, partial [Kiritimatiellae bacterium]|nr:hypothetical protein [Kiritimatiellia bacterium]
AKAALAAVFLAVLAVGGALLWRGRTEGTGEPVPPPVTPPVSVPEPLPAATPDSEGAEAQNVTSKYMSLKTDINIKKSDAKDKMGRIEAFRSEKEGFEERLESADRQWKRIFSLAEPGNLAEAKAAFAIADEAEKQIARDLDWLVKNKAGRDAAKAASEEIAALLKGDAATFEAEKYAPKAYGDGVALCKQGATAFKKGEFAAAGRLMGQARARFAAAAGIATRPSSGRNSRRTTGWDRTP